MPLAVANLNIMVLCMLTMTSLITTLRTMTVYTKYLVMVFVTVIFVAGCASEPPVPDEISRVEFENKEGEISEKDLSQAVEPEAETKASATDEKSEPVAAVKESPPEPKPEVMVPKQVEQPKVSVAKVTPALPPVTAVPSSPNHFIITAEPKDATHPHFGTGHSMGFVVNGKQGQDIIVRRGQTYQLEVKTDPKHDVYVSSKAIGWGSSVWTKGVEGAFIYEGVITFKPDKETPNILYYSCRNHPHMGGRIIVTSKGQTVDSIIGAEPVSPAAASESIVPIPVTQVNVTAAIVNQKLMFADMLAKSQSAKDVIKSGLPEAISKQNQAVSLIAASRKQLSKGKNAQAFESANEAVALLKDAKKLIPSQADIAQLKANYTDLQESLQNFEVSHKKSYAQVMKKEGAAAVVDYDKKKVERYKSSAAQAALKGDYAKAVSELAQAQRLVTSAMQKMLESKTLVYDLKFESPQEEYEYELKRFASYEELIPIAVEAKKPAEGAKKLMETYLAKGRKLRDAAINKAAAGDYPTGIAMLLDATKEVRRALRMVGVTQ